MTFVTPLIAGIAAAIAIPALVILYFLKLKRRDVEVSTTLLWKKAIQDLQANAPFQKLRRNILLLLQLIVLGLVLFAVAQPEFKDQGITNKRHIIMIDRSASMAALDGGTDFGTGGGTPIARLEAAKEQAYKVIEALKEPAFLDDQGEEAMVIAFDTTAEVRQTFTSNKADLRAAVRAIDQADSPTSLERAYVLAKAYTGDEKFTVQEDIGFVPSTPGAAIHLISDGRLPDAARVKTGTNDSVTFYAVGDPASINMGITGIRATRAFDNPNRLAVFVGLQSTSPAPVKVDVELSIDGNVQQVRGIEIAAATPPAPSAVAEAETSGTSVMAAPGLGGFIFPLERPEGGVGIVRIRAPAGTTDVLATDDVAYFVFPPARRLSVAVVTEGNLWLRYALESMTLSKLDVLKPSEFQKRLDDGSTAEYDVFVFDRVLPQVKRAVLTALPNAAPTSSGASSTPLGPTATAPTPPGAGAPTATGTAAALGGGAGGNARVRGLPPGRSLVLGITPPAPLGADLVGTYDTAVIADYVKDHPALALSGIDRLALGKGNRVEIAADTPVKAIASSDKGPVALEITDASLHALVLTFDPFSTNWPLESGWVLFLTDALTYLGEVNAGQAAGLINVGSTLQSRLPLGAEQVRLSLPDSERVPLDPGLDGTVAFGPVNKTGIYTLSWDGPATALDLSNDGRAVRAMAANLADPAESDTTPAASLALARQVVTAADERQVNLTRKLWPWLVLAALAMVLLEWFVYNKKVSL